MTVADKRTGWRWGAPRLISRGQLRSYLQIEDDELAKRMARGQVPGPIWGSDPALPSARWDRHAVDRALDRASSIVRQIDADQAETDRAFGFDTPQSPKPWR